MRTPMLQTMTFGTSMRKSLKIGVAALAMIGCADASVAQGLCAAPIGPYDVVNTTLPKTVVGKGPAVCSEENLAAALAKGGVITFGCGPKPVTIKINNPLTIRHNIDTIIDGGNKVTLDGQGITRILSLNNGGYLSRNIKVVLQNITIANGANTNGPMIPYEDPPCAAGYTAEASGGAVFIRDAITHIINTKFVNNTGPSHGPNAGGGALWVHGNRETLIVGSTFTGNRASNGGAIASNNAHVSIFNSVFDSNQAIGYGSNNRNYACASTFGGSGGLGGAVYLDGSEAADVHVCGSRFISNSAGASAGAYFRTKNSAGLGNIYFDRVVFDRNSAPSGGAAFVKSYNFSLKESTFSNNEATGTIGGALFVAKTNLDFVNNTFFKNAAAQLGGAIYALNTDGNILHQTFSGNNITATGNNGYGAVIHVAQSPAPIDIRNSVMIDNLSRNCAAPMSCSGGAYTGGSNLQWPATKFACNKGTKPDTLCTGGTAFTHAGFSSVLALNGGPTPNLLPPLEGPADDLGSNCPPTDQRGAPRPADGCTLGSVE